MSEGDEIWVDPESNDSSDDPAGTAAAHKETAAETRVIKDLASRGIVLRAAENMHLTFSPNSKWESPAIREVRLPRDMVPALLAQLENGVEYCTEHAGITIPSEGYVEILIGPNQTVPSRFLLDRIKRLTADNDADACGSRCSSSSMPALDLDPFESDGNSHTLVLHGPEACLQISGPSPACHVLTNYETRTRARYTQSIRVFHKEPANRQKLEESAWPLLNSLMYELDVRNHLNVRPVRWPSSYERRPARLDPPATIVRYPETKVDAEVSVLFSFAGSATGNPPLAFLSYYQVLESYFSIANQRHALSLLKTELSDPMFDRRQDKYLQRILALGEKAAIASEIGQLKTLLSDFVRGDRLHSFFEGNNWGKHFTKNGPIVGVDDNINPLNKQTPLSAQVADRVYRIRNRIVHSKDDPKYVGAPALLPQSEEAEALWPDIALARMLCCEVILSVQNRDL